MVIGRGSPILMYMLKLANAPVVPIFGNGSVKIQPIYVEDFVLCMLYIIANDIFDNDTLEIGGPEPISFERFFARLHAQMSLRTFRPVHIPIRPVSRILESLENRFLFLLPFTAGQLASFANDGTITENHLFDRFVSSMKPIDEMLSRSLPSDAAVDISTGLLERECRHLTQYLTGDRPEDYVMAKYVEGHKTAKLGKDANQFDALLIKIASRNMLFTKLTDVYTRVFYRNAVFRQKLVLLLAIIECCSMSSTYIDSVSEGARPLIYLKLLARAILFALLLFVSATAFVPLHVLMYLPKQRFGKTV